MVMKENLYGLLAEFNTPTELVAAAAKVREAGYTKTDGFSPFPIHEMDEALGIKRSKLSFLIFGGGLLGLLGGLGMQAYLLAVEYPLNVGGRPYLSWPSFIPITFECTVLLASATAVFGMLLLNGLPMPYHPVFNVPRFALASRDKFFLVIEAADPQFEHGKTSEFMQSLHPQEVYDVDE